MTVKIGSVVAVLVAGLLLAAAACGTTDATRAPANGTQETPDVQATLTALAQRQSLAPRRLRRCLPRPEGQRLNSQQASARRPEPGISSTQDLIAGGWAW